MALGRIHREAGLLEEALPYFEQLAELRPDDPEVIGALDYIRGFLPADALDLLEQAHTLTLEALETEPIRSRDQHPWRDILTLVDDATELAPTAPDVLRARARTYSYVHWHVRAWEYWQDYLEAGGTLADPAGLTPLELTSEALFIEAGTELGLARYQSDLKVLKDEALGIYLAVLEQFPDQPEALTEAARIYLDAEQTEQALPLLEQLAQLEPDNADVLGVVTGIHFDAGRFEETLRFLEQLAIVEPDGALERYRAVLESLPEDEETLRVEALTAAADILLDADRLEEALPLLEQLAILEPDDEVVLGWLGRIHLGADRLAQALPYFEQLTEIRPDDPEIVSALDHIRDSLVQTHVPTDGVQPQPVDVNQGIGGASLRPLPPIVLTDHPRQPTELPTGVPADGVTTIGPRTGIILDASRFTIERAAYITVYSETGVLREFAYFHHQIGGTLDSARQRPEVADNPEVFEVSRVINGGFEVILNDREAQRFLLLLQGQDLIASENALILGGE